MDIEKIKQIVNTQLPDATKESLIISVIATDKNVIPNILSIIQIERENNKELILDCNMELSRALLTLEKNNKKIIDPKWVTQEIKKFYKKWENTIKCNFKIDGLD